MTGTSTLPRPPGIHLLAIGNELLNAETRETNLGWLIRRLTRRGGRILRAAMVPDEFPAIADEIDKARKGCADLLVTTGGLGPTDDDATLAAIGSALGLKMRLNNRALKMVKERLEAIARMRHRMPHKMTKERRTMAIFPTGTEPLHNPAGVAPGMILRDFHPTIIALPGVPIEMKGIVQETLAEFWDQLFDGLVYVKKNILIKGIPEADLWPFVRRAGLLDPAIYVKTRLKFTGKSMKIDTAGPSTPEKLPWGILLHFSVVDSSRREGLDRIHLLVENLTRDLQKNYKLPYFIDL